MGSAWWLLVLVVGVCADVEGQDPVFGDNAKSGTLLGAQARVIGDDEDVYHEVADDTRDHSPGFLPHMHPEFLPQTFETDDATSALSGGLTSNDVDGVHELMSDLYEEAFNVLDFDGSGGISYDEMKQSVHPIIFVSNPAHFSSMDTNGDGEVDFNEFKMFTKAQLMQTFMMLSGGVGHIDPKTCSSFLESNPQTAGMSDESKEKYTEVVMMADLNHSGEISLYEFLDYSLRALVNSAAMFQFQNQYQSFEIDELFYMFSQGEEVMSKDGVAAMVGSMGFTVTPELVAKQLSEMDLNGDGLIDKPEFRVFLEGLIAQHWAMLNLEMRAAIDEDDVRRLLSTIAEPHSSQVEYQEYLMNTVKSRGVITLEEYPKVMYQWLLKWLQPSYQHYMGANAPQSVATQVDEFGLADESQSRPNLTVDTQADEFGLTDEAVSMPVITVDKSSDEFGLTDEGASISRMDSATDEFGLADEGASMSSRSDEFGLADESVSMSGGPDEFGLTDETGSTGMTVDSGPDEFGLVDGGSSDPSALNAALPSQSLVHSGGGSITDTEFNDLLTPTAGVPDEFGLVDSGVTNPSGGDNLAELLRTESLHSEADIEFDPLAHDVVSIQDSLEDGAELRQSLTGQTVLVDDDVANSPFSEQDIEFDGNSEIADALGDMSAISSSQATLIGNDVADSPFSEQDIEFDGNSEIVDAWNDIPDVEATAPGRAPIPAFQPVIQNGVASPQRSAGRAGRAGRRGRGGRTRAATAPVGSTGKCCCVGVTSFGGMVSLSKGGPTTEGTSVDQVCSAEFLHSCMNAAAHHSMLMFQPVNPMVRVSKSGSCGACASHAAYGMFGMGMSAKNQCGPPVPVRSLL